jgi:hypothetical protein
MRSHDTRSGQIPGMLGSAKLGPFGMQAGTHFVGDLCYVLNDHVWKELCAMMFAIDKINGTYGKFTLSNGREVVLFNMPMGDGFYKDSADRTYCVDSGTIGITTNENLKEEYGTQVCNGPVGEVWDSRLKRLGNIIQYDENFMCMTGSIDGSIRKKAVDVMVLGDHVVIELSDEDEDLSDSEWFDEDQEGLDF